MKQPILAITQRVGIDPATGERRDAMDQRWAALAAKLGAVLAPLPNHSATALALIQSLDCQGLILSGGNDIGDAFITSAGSRPLAGRSDAPERDETESSLLRHSVKIDLPVLGVCRGFQALNVFHGGLLSRVETSHVATRHEVVLIEPAFGRDAGVVHVNSFHNFAIGNAQLSPSFRALGVTGDTVEIARHRDIRHLGVMWHPERETPFDESDLMGIREHFGIGLG